MALKYTALAFWRGFGERSLIWGAAAAGCALGAILRLPLLPPLQESAANVIGAAVGAVLAVAGAAYVSNMQAAKSRNTASTLLLITLQELDRGICFVLELAAATDAVANAELQPGHYREHRERILASLAAVFAAVRELAHTTRRIESRVAIFTTNLGHVDPHVAITAVDAQACIKKHQALLVDVLEDAPVVPPPIHLQSVLGTGECHTLYARRLNPFREEIAVLLKFLR